MSTNNFRAYDNEPLFRCKHCGSWIWNLKDHLDNECRYYSTDWTKRDPPGPMNRQENRANDKV